MDSRSQLMANTVSKHLVICLCSKPGANDPVPDSVETAWKIVGSHKRCGKIASFYPNRIIENLFSVDI